MTTKYIDWNRGSDSNDGSTPALAWKNLTKIDDTAYAAGDAFLLASDSVWEYDIATRIAPPNTWTGTRSNPVVIGRYAVESTSTSLPTIRWNRRLLTTDWTYDAGNNCWYYDAPFSIGDYCMVRVVGTWLPSRTGAASGSAGLPLASVDGRYHNGSGGTATRFYMYAPSGTNPTTYYGEVLLGITGTGLFTVSSARGFVKFQDLRFEETGNGISGFSGTAADVGIIVHRIEGETVSTLVSGVVVGATGQLYVDIKELDITDWGSTAVWTYASAGAGFRQVDIARCRIHDGMHNYSQGAIYHQVRTTGMRSQIYDNVFSGVRFGTRDKTADGCAIYCEIGSSDTDVYRNRVDDSYMAYQDNSGRANRWFSNIATGCKTFMKLSDETDVGAMDAEIFGNTAIVGASVSPEFGSGDTGTGIRCITDVNQTGVRINNNLFVNTGSLVGTAILTPSTTITTRNFDNNAVTNYTYVAKREFGPFTTETVTGTVTADPLLTDSYKPRPGSPLLGAGTHLGYTRDIDRKQRPNPPAIGAYDVATMRTPE